MSHAATVAHAPTQQREVLGVTTGKMAMWLFLGSDGMSFMGLIAAYVALRIGNWSNWPDPTQVLAVTLTGINTFILICSSVFMVKAFEGASDGNVPKLKFWLFLTVVGGATFLGIQIYEYNSLIHHGIKLFDSAGRPIAEWYEHATPELKAAMLGKSTLFANTFYVCTCFHGFHVLSGVVYLGLVWIGVMRGRWTVNRIEIAGLYWHFVDLVWIVIFTIIYLF
jgi:heme/copper-type cytochrome/quinol oxidase subunit 3